MAEDILPQQIDPEQRRIATMMDEYPALAGDILQQAQQGYSADQINESLGSYARQLREAGGSPRGVTEQMTGRRFQEAPMEETGGDVLRNVLGRLVRGATLGIAPGPTPSPYESTGRVLLEHALPEMVGGLATAPLVGGALTATGIRGLAGRAATGIVKTGAGPGATAARAAIAEALAGAPVGAVAGGGAEAVRQAVEEPRMSPRDILMHTLTGAGTGALVGGAVGGIFGRAMDPLRQAEITGPLEAGYQTKPPRAPSAPGLGRMAGVEPAPENLVNEATLIARMQGPGVRQEILDRVAQGESMDSVLSDITRRLATERDNLRARMDQYEATREKGAEEYLLSQDRNTRNAATLEKLAREADARGEADFAESLRVRAMEYENARLQGMAARIEEERGYQQAGFPSPPERPTPEERFATTARGGEPAKPPFLTPEEEALTTYRSEAQREAERVIQTRRGVPAVMVPPPPAPTEVITPVSQEEALGPAISSKGGRPRKLVRVDAEAMGPVEGSNIRSIMIPLGKREEGLALAKQLIDRGDEVFAVGPFEQQGNKGAQPGLGIIEQQRALGAITDREAQALRALTSAKRKGVMVEGALLEKNFFIFARPKTPGFVMNPEAGTLTSAIPEQPSPVLMQEVDARLQGLYKVVARQDPETGKVADWIILPKTPISKKQLEVDPVFNGGKGFASYQEILDHLDSAGGNRLAPLQRSNADIANPTAVVQDAAAAKTPPPKPLTPQQEATAWVESVYPYAGKQLSVGASVYVNLVRNAESVQAASQVLKEAPRNYRRLIGAAIRKRTDELAAAHEKLLADGQGNVVSHVCG